MKQSTRNKVHWLCDAPSPYNDFLFQKLSGEPSIDLTVHFRKFSISSHPWQHEMATGFNHHTYKTSASLAWQLVKASMKNKDSIFFIGGWHYPSILMVMFILRFKGSPYVVWTDTPWMAGRNIIKEKCRSMLLKYIFKHAAAVMGTGQPGVDALKSMGAHNNKAVNFPYWVPIPENNGNNIIVQDAKPIIFFCIGRLIKKKAFDLAITSFSDVIRFAGPVKPELWIFGEGPERTKLEAMTDYPDLKGSVKFWGWQDPGFIQEKIKKAHIFVHTASREAYGVVVLEAMAMGKPVLGSDKTMAVVDRVSDGVSGFIHQVGNTDQLAEQMKFFIEHPKKIASMGKKARQTTEEWPVEKGINIIKSILQKECSAG